MARYFHTTLLALLCAASLHAQTTLRGAVTDAETTAPLADAAVSLNGTALFAATDKTGHFTLPNVPKGRYTVVVTHLGYVPSEQTVDVGVTAKGDQIVNVALQRDAAAVTTTSAPVSVTGDIPTVTLEEADSDTEGAGEVANVLHASRDVFQTISGFGWSTFRFRERGYNSDQFQVFLNGIPFNDPESGSAFFGEFGGLNDVLRNRTSTVGLDPAEFAFSEIGGATNIDLRASNQRKQTRISYASSNRIYRNRLMATVSTGLMPRGWAVSASYSRRWANEGYVAGTFFEANAYFLSVDKKFGSKHSLNAVVFGAPTRRGRSADSFDEMYQLAGSNYYNPLWGSQNGEERNSQVATNNQPVGMLRYDWTPSYRTHVTLATYTQVGTTGFTRLNWLGGNNPAPDFNRRLPSSYPDSLSALAQAEALSADEAFRQIDWAALYDANRRTPATIFDANGQPGNTVTGNRSVYIVENQKTRNTELGANLFFNHALTNRVMLSGGGFYQWYKGENYKVVDDLLGGEFWTDFDFYSQFDPNKGLGGNSDIRNPNRLAKQGDVFGYNYNENIRRSQAWGQAQWNLPRLQLFGAAEVGNNTLWRTGLMQNGRFPDNSLGDSKKVNFNTWSAKGGITWKVNGRNYLYANGLVGTRAPQYRNVFVAPRTRDLVLDDVRTSNVESIEGGFIHRSPRLRIRVSGYITNYRNEIESVFASAQTTSRVLQNLDYSALNLDDDVAELFLQSPIFFGAAVMTGVSRRHSGVELGLEYKLTPHWQVSGALATGRYQYTSRPHLYLSLDNTDADVFDLGEVYQKGFYVPRTPQTAGSLSLRYEGNRFWFASLTGNYAAQLWYDFDRLRRTANFTDAVEPTSAIYQTIVEQQRAPDAFTLDFFAGKSWRIQTKYFVNLNVGVNNLLNDQNIVISGRESYRNAFRRDVSDPRFYTSEVIYAFGTNYFAQVTLRF